MKSNDQTVYACPICENMHFYVKSASLRRCEFFLKTYSAKISLRSAKKSNAINVLWKKKNYCKKIHPEQNVFNLKKWTKGILEVDQIPKEDFQIGLQSKLVKYVEHINLKKIQSAALIEDKNTLKNGEVLIQTDFAENYSIKYASEVMEKHWTSVPGVVILTAVVYFKDGDNLCHKSYAVCSDVRTNTTLEMVYMLEGVLVDLLLLLLARTLEPVAL